MNNCSFFKFYVQCGCTYYFFFKFILLKNIYNIIIIIRIYGAYINCILGSYMMRANLRAFNNKNILSIPATIQNIGSET